MPSSTVCLSFDFDALSVFFILGHTVESFPRETLERGHEVAHHSYAHVDPPQQTADEKQADMDRALGDVAAGLA